MSVNGSDRRDRVRGAILGTAVGDALGLPAEGLGRRRSARMFAGPWRHRFLLGRGMVSDDTEHTVFVAQALLASGEQAEVFVRRLGWSLRWWLLALPAGVGFATLRSIARMWCGLRPPRCAVFSAGNGPAMRVAPIGVRFADQAERLDEFVTAATTLTHRDPKAAVAALAVARAVAWGTRHGTERRPFPDEFLALLASCGDDPEWGRIVDHTRQAIDDHDSVPAFAGRLGQQDGVTGYSYHTVPVAAYAWYRHYGDFVHGLVAVLELGGDADTIGAITGGMLGSAVGESGIPGEWIDGIADWPRGVPLLRRLADRLADPGATAPVTYPWPGVLPRNLLFLAVVLAHGLRRLLPPY